MKQYKCEYRSRGLPDSPVSVDYIDAKNYFDAMAKAAERAGEEKVILRVTMIRKESGDELSGVPKADIQSNS